jgi:hypothetical protein
MPVAEIGRWEQLHNALVDSNNHELGFDQETLDQQVHAEKAIREYVCLAVRMELTALSV